MLSTIFDELNLRMEVLAIFQESSAPPPSKTHRKRFQDGKGDNPAIVPVIFAFGFCNFLFGFFFTVLEGAKGKGALFRSFDGKLGG